MSNHYTTTPEPGDQALVYLMQYADNSLYACVVEQLFPGKDPS